MSLVLYLFLNHFLFFLFYIYFYNLFNSFPHIFRHNVLNFTLIFLRWSHCFDCIICIVLFFFIVFYVYIYGRLVWNKPYYYTSSSLDPPPSLPASLSHSYVCPHGLLLPIYVLRLSSVFVCPEWNVYLSWSLWCAPLLSRCALVLWQCCWICLVVFLWLAISDVAGDMN